MSIPLDRISRVVIAGEWFSVERGTFRVEEMTFTGEDGEPTHAPIDMKAYHFVTPNRDEYYGPLAHIQLIKLLDLS